ncbi:MAG: hypothetical protein HC915_01330 [Anaerolineae bacterium]|nr:hypothetical protein [Anaerolineae bacterium]
MNASPLSAAYRIRVQGHLGASTAARFPGMAICFIANGQTDLTGTLADQAALHGVLRTIRDCGLELLSVNRLEPNEAQEGA